MKVIENAGSTEDLVLPLPDNKKSINAAITGSWEKIAPLWPLKNLIAVNPIAGFEDMEFQMALKHAHAYFQQNDLPLGMQNANRESIKWLQAFLDQGQSTICMPHRDKGLLASSLLLMPYDKRLHSNDRKKIMWLEHLPGTAEAIIAEVLSDIGIHPHDSELFLTLMLTTLPGWAAYIRYRTKWADAQDLIHPHTVTEAEYLAFRLILTYLLWPEAKQLLQWHKQALKKSDIADSFKIIASREASYQQSLVRQLKLVPMPRRDARARAQMVFCIDVRSEPFRRALESQGDYETYGFAGFFGVPVSVENTITGDIYASCPVLLKPSFIVRESSNSYQLHKKGIERLTVLRKTYQSLKNNFTTPFSLVETLGLASGVWMGIRSLTPRGAAFLQSTVYRITTTDYAAIPDIGSIPFHQQIKMGAGALKMMGLTEKFAELVIFCGHGSTTENNAYATGLDCGACGGRHGGSNARILAAILNDRAVRRELCGQEIDIPDDTWFIAAEHNTTTDEVEIFSGQIPDSMMPQITSLKNDLEIARDKNSFWRSAEMGVKTDVGKAKKATAIRAKDWAQVRPEWGLARNASFIAGPRWLTKGTDLEGRSFLHSYEWEKDEDASSLTTILTAPMVVAQWINAQYFFSTLDNVAFGGGSKVTKNITGKIGVMQGNASDLMNGLPLQSVYRTDDQPYHKPVRLTVIVYAPKTRIERIIQTHEVLLRLFGNSWIFMICIDPVTHKKYKLQNDFTWVEFPDR